MPDYAVALSGSVSSVGTMGGSLFDRGPRAAPVPGFGPSDDTLMAALEVVELEELVEVALDLIGVTYLIVRPLIRKRWSGRVGFMRSTKPLVRGLWMADGTVLDVVQSEHEHIRVLLGRPQNSRPLSVSTAWTATPSAS